MPSQTSDEILNELLGKSINRINHPFDSLDISKQGVTLLLEIPTSSIQL